MESQHGSRRWSGARRRRGGELVNLDGSKRSPRPCSTRDTCSILIGPLRSKTNSDGTSACFTPLYCERQVGLGSCSMQTECLLKANSSTRLTVKVRFLQIVQRSIGKLRAPAYDGADGDCADPDLNLSIVSRWLGESISRGRRRLKGSCLQRSGSSNSLLVSDAFFYSRRRTLEYLRDEQGLAVGVIVRELENSERVG